jgi:predicted XRE-type DNA-binding protein
MASDTTNECSASACLTGGVQAQPLLPALEIANDTQGRRNMRKKSDDDLAKINVEEGSGNVFADLGLEDADELFARAQLGFHVYQLLTARKLKQREAASLLGIKPREVSHLMNGHFSRFTTNKLLDFLKRLGQKVTIQVRPHQPGEPFQEIGFGR